MMITITYRNLIIAYLIQLQCVIQDKIQSEAKFSLRQNLVQDKFSLRQIWSETKFSLREIQSKTKSEKFFIGKIICQKKFSVFVSD